MRRTVHQPSGTYDVVVGHELLDRLRGIISDLAPGRPVALLLASGIEDRWGETIRNGLGGPAATITFPDSEARKNLRTVESILTSMLEARVRRDWVAVVAGGGSAGDTGGFAASIFQRGIPYVHVPTTLLAQVDSSLGGKLGVNHESGKNLIGVFAPPLAVISDLDTLSTLPGRELRSGLYEMLKAGVIGDARLFEMMAGDPEGAMSRGEGFGEMVERAIDVKIAVVTEDEREGDRRRLLNYGHTIGHGFEVATGYGSLTHGDAVAWGMIAANEIARSRGLVDDSIRERIDAAILGFEPEALPPLDPETVLRAIGLDKKFSEGRRVMILPEEIGRCGIYEDVSLDEIEQAMTRAIEASRHYEARA